MAVVKKVFTVDGSGNVAIEGNIFVKSAENADSGWIVGDMINARSVIQLADGSIILNGSNGTVSVYDPANTKNGNYISISNGFCNQYENGKLTTSLSMIDTGVVRTGTWTQLSGTYTEAPTVIVTPCAIQSFLGSYRNSNQKLSLSFQLQQASGGTYRIYPTATIAVENGSTAVTPVQTWTNIEENSWAEVLGTYYHGTQALKNSVSPNPECVSDPVVVRGTNKITASVSTQMYSIALVDGDYPNVINCINTLRLEARPAGSTGSYTSVGDWVSVQTNNPHVQNVTVWPTLPVYWLYPVLNLPSTGDWEVRFHWKHTPHNDGLLGWYTNNTGGQLSPDRRVTIESITAQTAGANVSISGTVNYIAVGK